MKCKRVFVFILVSMMLFLVGCQNAQSEPMKVVIVGSEITGSEESAPIKVSLSNQQWEYLEVTIMCTDTIENPGCSTTAFGVDPGDERYPDRVSILNEIGEEGWELIYHGNPKDSTLYETVDYVFKRIK